MKNLFIAFLFLPLFSFAQEITPAIATEAAPKNEFGFHVASASIIDGIEDEFGKLTLLTDYYFFDGVYYKRHFGKWALRTSFNYHKKVEEHVYNPQSNIFEYSIRLTREMIYKVGLERSFGTGKVQFYALADLNFMHRDIQRELVGTRSVRPVKNSYHSIVYGPGLSAGFGVRYNPTKNITLSYEANLAVNYMFNNQFMYSHPGLEGRINVGTFGIGIRF